MAVAGTIFSLDLGVRSGFAYGVPSARPVSGAVILKAADQHRSVAFSNLICFLAEHWGEVKPALVVKEAMLPLQAFRTLGNAEHTIRMTSGLHAVVEAMCVRFAIPFEDIADSTIRKHFIGRARLGTRTETKRAVVNRCHVLGLMPRDCLDDNRADALALFDLAAATHGRRAPDKLFLFDESVSPSACQTGRQVKKAERAEGELSPKGARAA